MCICINANVRGNKKRKKNDDLQYSKQEPITLLVSIKPTYHTFTPTSLFLPPFRPSSRPKTLPPSFDPSSLSL